MQKVNDLIPKGRNSFSRIASQMPAYHDMAAQPNNDSEQVKSWFKKAYLRIKAVIPGWSNNVSEELEREIQKDWYFTFLEHGICNDESLDRGIAGLKEREQHFRPSSIEFVNLCKPSLTDLGLPELDVAFKEAVQKAYQLRYPDKTRPLEWSHIVVRNAATACLSSLIDDQTKEALANFEREYKYVVGLFKSGKLSSKNVELGYEEKPIDPNLSAYLSLLKTNPDWAKIHLDECASRGIFIDPIKMSVSKGEVAAKPIELDAVSDTKKPVIVENKQAYSLSPEKKQSQLQGLYAILDQLPADEVNQAARAIAPKSEVIV